MADWEEQNILFLKGVNLEDFVSIEDRFNQSLLDVDAEEKTMEEPWDTLPRFFTSTENHPKETNLLCWFCSLGFKTKPWFIIKYCNNTPKGVVMDIEGNFCSCGCLMGFVLEHFDKLVDFDKKFNVYKLYRMWTGKDISHIEAPKSRYCMQMYGGEMTLEQYRYHVREVDARNMNAAQLAVTNATSHHPARPVHHMYLM